MTDETQLRRVVPAEIVDGDLLDPREACLVDADGVALTLEGGLLPALLSRVVPVGWGTELPEYWAIITPRQRIRLG